METLNIGNRRHYAATNAAILSAVPSGKPVDWSRIMGKVTAALEQQGIEVKNWTLVRSVLIESRIVRRLPCVHKERYARGRFDIRCTCEKCTRNREHGIHGRTFSQ